MLQRTRNKAYFFIHPSVTSVLPFHRHSAAPLISLSVPHPVPILFSFLPAAAWSRNTQNL